MLFADSIIPFIAWQLIYSVWEKYVCLHGNKMFWQDFHNKAYAYHMYKNWIYLFLNKIKYAAIFTHYIDVTMGVMASQITSFTIVYSTIYPGADQRKHQSSASLAFVRGIHRWAVNSPHIGPVTRKIFPFDYVTHVEHWYTDTSTPGNQTFHHLPVKTIH